MADSVYYHLERMLPELDDLKERSLFTVEEVKEIARRRREFEFRLERRAKLKEDYLNYIQYELQLEKLRRLRKKALVRDLQASRRSWQPSLCDRTSAMHIMLIYERATTRFKGDLGLWMQYLQYCRSQGTRRMQKVLTKALRLHPMVPGLWIYAAAWEFEHNANIAAARALMQRGLRMCPQSEKLWLEYFRMELVYAERLKTNNYGSVLKKKVLKANENGDSEDDDDELILRIDDDDEELHEETKLVLPEHKAGMESSKIDELGYRLACTIYRNAVTAFPSNPEFRQSFMEILQKASFAQAPALQDEILKSLEKDFPMDAGCWDWQARIRFETTGQRDEAIKVYENALGVISSVDMHERYAQFLKEVSGLECTNNQGTSITLEHQEEDRLEAATRLLQLYSRSKESGVLSPCLTEGHVTLLLRLGKLDAARQLLDELCLGDLRTCARLWAMRIMLEMKKEAVVESGLSRIADLCEESLKQIPIAEVKDIWAVVLEYFGGQVKLYDRIIDMMVYKIAGSVGDQTCAKLVCSLIDWILYSQDIKHARKIYNRILALPGPSIELYKHCIGIECRMSAMGCKDAVKCMRRLFQSAVDKYSQDAELWLEYCSQEIKAGNLDAAGSIYWRAKKTLDDPLTFIEGYQRLLSKEG